MANGELEPVMGAVLDQWHDGVGSSWEVRPHVIGMYMYNLSSLST